MYSDDDLDAAVSAGVLDGQAAAAFRSFAEGRRAVPAVDEEYVRLVSGFNDIFVVIAAQLLLGALAVLAGRQSLALGGLVVAGGAWALSEYFTRKRRMALPSIVLLLNFVGGAVYGVGGLGAAGAGLFDFPFVGWTGAAAMAAGAGAALLHWWRFRVPITVAAGGAATLATLLLALVASVPAIRGLWLPLVLVGGVLLFAWALRWDLSDRERRTRRSDVAFWLHLVAAPAIVHPIFAVLVGHGAGWGSAAATVAAYLALAMVALVIDRRALLVSALAYVLYALSSLMEHQGVVGVSFAGAALVIGSALLMLSAGWHHARTLLVRRLPAGWQQRLPAV